MGTNSCFIQSTISAKLLQQWLHVLHIHNGISAYLKFNKYVNTIDGI